MQYKNLQRAAQIADELPRLENARKFLSGEDAYVAITCGFETVRLPSGVNLNVINIINLEINRLKDEIKEL